MSIERNVIKRKSNQCERTIVNLAINCRKILSDTVFPNEVNAAEFCDKLKKSTYFKTVENHKKIQKRSY